MKIKEIQVTRKFNANAAKSLSVIEEIKNAFRLKREYESWSESDTFWAFGSNFSPNNKQRIKLAGWFGFEANPKSGPQRSVWIYYTDKAKANLELLRSSSSGAE